MSSTIGEGESRGSNASLASRIDNDYFNSDLTFNAISTAFIGTLGYAFSWINPMTIPQILKNFNSENHFHDKISAAGLISNISVAGGYLLGTYHNIERIAEEPTNWMSYIPVATNAVFGGILYLNDRVEKRAKSKNSGFKIGEVINL